MSNFWPTNFALNDTESPMEILETARKQWESESGNNLTLVLEPAKSQGGYDMIIIHARHVPSSRTTTLFSITHRPNAPYPLTINPKDDELPLFLQRSYYEPGSAGFSNIKLALGGGTPGHTVTNEWVCDTPGEFRDKLATVFNLGMVKCEVLSLVANRPPEQASENKITAKKPVEDEKSDP